MAVLDSSFIVKLVIHEPYSEEALNLFRKLTTSGEKLRTPCIALAEVLNAIWKHIVLLKDLDQSQVGNVLRYLTSLWRLLHVHPIDELAENALNVATRLAITVHDAFYIVLALQYREVLYTFDRKLAAKAEEVGVETVVPSES